MKIKKLILQTFALILCIVFCSSNTMAQEDSTSVKQNEKPAIYWLFDSNYRLATRYSDFAQAKSSLYSLVTIEPQNDSLLFNLAFLYYDNQVYASCILVCMDLLNLKPNHPGALEISALSYENLGLKDKALTSYENLYLSTEGINILYKMAYLQYELKRYAECIVNIDILLSKGEADTETVIFQINETEQKKYKLKVAALNLKGLVNEANGDMEGARKAYNDALALAPDFVYAKENLEKLDK